MGSHTAECGVDRKASEPRSNILYLRIGPYLSGVRPSAKRHSGPHGPVLAVHPAHNLGIFVPPVSGPFRNRGKPTLRIVYLRIHNLPIRRPGFGPERGVPPFRNPIVANLYLRLTIY